MCDLLPSMTMSSFRVKYSQILAVTPLSSTSSLELNRSRVRQSLPSLARLGSD